MQPLVSILMVAYNADNFIGKTIRSCLEQSYDPVELLILDNNSDDRTREVIASYNDPRIRLFNNDVTLNPYEGLNYLLQRASGQYIAIQDHDDIWLRDKIHEQVAFLNNNPDFIACGTNTYFFYENRNILILIDNPATADIVAHTSLIFRRRDFCYHPDYVLADEHFMRRVLRSSGKIACLQEPFCIHRIRADARNLSSHRFSLSMKNVKDFFVINGLTLRSSVYFCYLLIHDLIPESMMWLIRKKISLRKKEWISLSAFKSRYPEVLL